MKILFVSIPNHHFFQWANQLKESGYEVFWFDITDRAGFSEKINWVKQFNGWKLKWHYPFRYRIKKSFPKCYSFLEKISVHKVEVVFDKILKEIQPDIIHCFEMKLAGLPILASMQKNKIPFIYSSWGSDVFYFKEHGIRQKQFEMFLKRVDCLVSDCMRDYTICYENGFKNKFAGVFPGNGGISFPREFIQPQKDRKIILIKGYESFGCKASKIIEALQLVPQELLSGFKIVLYSADEVIINMIEKNVFFNSIKIEIYPRTKFVANEKLLQLMGNSCLHISNNISDGMPNTLLESMGMGAFPIQSNPGNVTAEVIQNGKNGFLIFDPLDNVGISELIVAALENLNLRNNALSYNVDYIQDKCDRKSLQTRIVNLYSITLENII